MEQTQSESIDELAKAMVEVQKKLGGAAKDATNPFFNSKYADLESVIEASRQLLTENGLCVLQTLGGTAESPSIITNLCHVSGQWIKGEGFMTPDKKGPQGVGSCITYGRRYGYSAMIGLYQTDDDAEGATDRNKKQAPKDTSKAGVDDIALDNRISEPQRRRLKKIASENNWADSAVKSMIAKHGFDSSKDILRGAKYKAIIDELEHGMEEGYSGDNKEPYSAV